MKFQIKSLFRIFAVLMLFTLFIVACTHKVVLKTAPAPTAEEPAPAPAPVEEPETQTKGTVLYHVWGALGYYGMEQKEYPGYSIYTYVLFNSNLPDAESVEGRRYDAILRAVLQDVMPQQIGNNAGWPKNETNIFCIPFVTRFPKNNDALYKYSFKLSQEYLAVLQGSATKNSELFKRLAHRPGPFLISLYEPMTRLQGKNVTKMLYLDLTDMPADGMRQILDAYKQRLGDEPIINVERLRESLKITLMRYALLIDENLRIVDVAFARIK
jgi:hypothetical protein